MSEIDLKLSPEAQEELRNADFKLSPETQEELQRALRSVVEFANQVYDALYELVQRLMESVRQIAAALGRFFLKQQLLEWKIPIPVADFVARNTPGYWAWRIGFNWFQRKYALKE